MTINNNPTNRAGAIDLLRHVLSVAVIIQHMPSHSRFDAGLNYFIRYVSEYVDGAVVGFFLIAGFFLSQTK